MNEPFDVEISRALKASADKGLQGWEFTPAMQARVMDRIRAAADDAPAAPLRRTNVAAIVRPIAWIAAAAAALMVVVNFGLPSMGSSKKEMAATSAPAAETMKPQAPAVSPTPSAPNQAQPSQKFTATGTADQPAPANKAAEAPSQNAVATTSAAEASPKAKTPSVALAVPPAPEGAAKAMAAPAGAMGKMGIAAAASNLAGAVMNNGAVVTLTPFGIKNADTWERPLADLNPGSMLAVAADGRMAVANGGDLIYLIDSRGEHSGTLKGEGAIGQILWSDDGRVASAEATRVVVYATDTGKAQFVLGTGENGQMAFAKDGMLAVFSDKVPDSHLLTLVDAKGRVLANAQPAVDGRGLAVSADGRVVVAGGQAYDRTGTARWQAPLKTAGVAALGADQFLVWDAHTVMAIRADDGVALWQAEWTGAAAPGVTRVVASADGRDAVVLAETEDGPVLWVLSSEGQLLESERLAQMPVDISVANDQVVLILPDTVDRRSIPR